MKSYLYILLSFWTLCFHVALAADTAPKLSLSVVETQPGSDWTLAVEVDNVADWNATAFQFDFTLPAGVHYADATIAATDRLANHVIYASTRTDGTLRVIALSVANKAIEGTSGPLFTLGLHADVSLAAGQYEVSLTQAQLSLRNGESKQLDPVAATFNVAEGDFYKLIFQADGTEVDRVSVLEGSSIESSMVPDAPAKEGYSFVEWVGLPDVMPAHDVTVEASYAINQYTISYLVDGQTYTSQQLDFGAAVVPPDAPTKEGYTFVEWQGLPATMPAADVKVEALYSVNQYTLTFLVEGEVFATQQVDFGAVPTLPDAPTKEGYTFVEWQGLPATMPAHDVTVEAVYSVNQYTLTFLVEGEVYATKQVDFGAVPTLPDAPELEGHTFVEWQDMPETMPAHDVVVTAVFTVNQYVLTYLVDGEVYATQKLYFGDEVVPTVAPEKEGYTFVEWKNLPATMPSHDAAVEAVYEVNTYQIRYYLNDELYTTQTVAYGETIVAPEVDESKYVDFSGWIDLPTTMPAHDLDIYGQATISSLTVPTVTAGSFSVFTLDGRLIRSAATRREALRNLPRGIYVVNGEKVAVN